MIDISNITRRYHLPPRCAITAEDLEQEGWLAILEREAELGRKLEDNEAYATARSAIRRFVIRYSGPVTRAPRSESVRLEDQLPDDALTPLQQLTHAETLIALRAAFTRLCPRHRLVLRRCFVDDKTCDEVARELGVSENNLRQLKFYALQRLGEILTEKK